MINLLRNILAIVIGAILGSVVNMAIITFGPALIPPPAGVDVTSAENLAHSIHLFGPQHFVMPFLAHAVGTLVGAFMAFLVAGSHRAAMAWVVGLLFLAGGIAACFMIPAPAWFMAGDLLLAYLPMTWLGIQIAARVAGKRAA